MKKLSALLKKIFNKNNKIYFKSVFLYFSSSIVSVVIGLAINPIMAKNLSPEDYSIMGYFSSFNIFITPLLNFSLISYYLRNYYKLSESRRIIVGDTILIALTIYSFFAFVVINFIFYFYFYWNKISFPYFPYALLTFTPIYFNNFLNLFLVNCRLKREAGKYSKITIFNALFSAVLAILFVVFLKYGATGRLIAILISSLISAIYCFFKLFNKIQFDWAVIKDAFKFGWPLSAAAILWYFFTGIDKSMLEKLNNNSEFALYNIGSSITANLMIFFTAISQTFEPDIFKAIAENKVKKLVKILGSIFFLNSIPNIIFIILAPLIMTILTYNRYTDSSDYARIFAIKNIALSLYYSLIAIMVGYGFTKSKLLLFIFGSIISIIIYKYMILYGGFYGAAWGQVLSFSILSLIILIFLIHKLKFRKNELLQ